MTIVGATWTIKYKKARRKPPVKKHLCYIERNDTLSWLGYPTYREYLASDDWAAIRSKKLSQNPACILCRSKAQQVHHMDYENQTLLGLCLDALVCLCDNCHRSIEIDDNGNKRSLRQANLHLFKLLDATGQSRWVAKTKKVLNRNIDLSNATMKRCGVCSEERILNDRRLCSKCQHKQEKRLRHILHTVNGNSSA